MEESRRLELKGIKRNGESGRGKRQRVKQTIS